MPRISEVIRAAALAGEWTLEAQRAAVWADLAPQLHDACIDAYVAIEQRRQPWGEKQLQAAHALCWDIAKAVYAATGLEAREALTSAGLPRDQAEKARLAAVKALGRFNVKAPDESVEYDGHGDVRA